MIQFEEIQPAADCPCAGCADRRRLRRTRSLPARDGGHPAAHGARRALVLVTAAGVVLGGGGAAGAVQPGDREGAPGTVGAWDHPTSPVREDAGPAGTGAGTTPTAVREASGRPEVREPATPTAVREPATRPVVREPATRPVVGVPSTRPVVRGEDPGGSGGPAPQGRPAPLHGQARPSSGASGASGPGGVAAAPRYKPATRADIIKRAKTWLEAKVPYSMTKYWRDGYRQDCSGYISMAWGLNGNEWTGSLAGFGVKVPREELQPGDILLFHNAADPHSGSHVTIFGGWTDYTHDHYVAYEQTRPTTRKQATPLGYWNNADRYVAYRYKGLVTGTAPQGASGAPAFPGTRYFRPGQSSPHVEKLGRQLVKRGFGKHYRVGPEPSWGEADRRNVEAFQRAQGWRGAAADGYPGPETWRRLFAVGSEGTQ
ncbi:peptidoglycan-binding protein [Streptomyces sp. NPDC058657]|uniref:peptidoglycan-binding protein n=1 Tax=unclassified Streptomyces TaxID=2593676 RepID=UPI0036539B0A